MTYKENYLIFLSLVDEFDPTLEMSTTDEDIRLKLANLYAPAYIFMANRKMDSKSKELSKVYTGEKGYTKVKLPSCRQVKRIFAIDETNTPTTGDFYYIDDNSIMVGTDKDYTYYCEYIPNVTNITKDTEDDFELEIPFDLQAVLPYKVACDLFKTDPSANYQAFMQEYQLMLNATDTSRKGMSVNISEGEL